MAYLYLNEQYYANNTNPKYNVLNIINNFYANVALYNQDIQYIEFLKKDLKIQIIIATTLLSIKVNIPNIKVVANWKFLINKQVRELQ